VRRKFGHRGRESLWKMVERGKNVAKAIRRKNNKMNNKIIRDKEVDAQ
jgi:hypothetical protein